VERVSLTVRAVAFEAGATAMGTGIRRSPLKATIEYDDGRRFAFRFEAGSADERFDGDPAPRETMFDLADVERWLTTAGIDAGAESASGLAQDVTLVLINAACGGELPQDLPTLRSAGVWTSRTVWPARWLVGAVVGPGLMLWVLWMRETIRARRRLRRTAPGAPGAA
jgi:hypothetical protein